MMMSTEMKLKETVRRMRSSRWWRSVMPALLVLSLIAVSLLTPLSVAVAHAQPINSERAVMSGCQNVQTCFQQVEEKIRNLRAYVRFLKPGDPVELTQAPRESSPQYRQGFEAFSSLRELFSSLAQSDGWESWPKRDADIWKNNLSDVQAKLERLGQASNRSAASAALSALSASEQRMARHYRKRKAVDGF